MRERVRQFHGEMIIESTGAGTTILVTFPHSKESIAVARPARLANPQGKLEA
jgi:signal transduction histidine kinase